MADQGPFVVDVLDYRSRRRRNLEDNAKRAAVEVLNGEQERIALPPMSPYERRIVHKYLQENFEELASESEGEGQDRHIVITYRGIPEEGALEEEKAPTARKQLLKIQTMISPLKTKSYADEVEVADEQAKFDQSVHNDIYVRWNTLSLRQSFSLVGFCYSSFLEIGLMAILGTVHSCRVLGFSP